MKGPHKVGCPTMAPFDVIVVNGAIATVPEAWSKQLKPLGRMVAVVSQGAVGKARLFVNQGGQLVGRNAFDATVPLLPGFEATKSFAFVSSLLNFLSA